MEQAKIPTCCFPVRIPSTFGCTHTRIFAADPVSNAFLAFLRSQTALQWFLSIPMCPGAFQICQCRFHSTAIYFYYSYNWFFFFSLNDLRQPTGCIFNFLCKAFCFSPRAVYLTVFSSFMHWYSYVIMYYFVTAEAWILRSSQPGGSLANNTQMAQKKSRCVLGGGLDKHCTHFFIGSFCAATSSERCQISSHWGKIVLFHGHDGFIVVVLWCLYSQSHFEHWFSAIKGEWFLTKTGEV